MSSTFSHHLHLDADRSSSRVKTLDRRLLGFHNAVQHLGSSSALLASAVQLRFRLAEVLLLLRENAASIFPGVRKDAIEPVPVVKGIPEAWSSTSSLPTVIAAGGVDPERIPEELEFLSADLYSFLEVM